MNKQKLLETEILNSNTKSDMQCNFVEEDTSDVNENNNSNIFSDSDEEENSFKIKINLEKLNKKVIEERIEEQISENLDMEVIFLFLI